MSTFAYVEFASRLFDEPLMTIPQEDSVTRQFWMVTPVWPWTAMPISCPVPVMVKLAQSSVTSSASITMLPS